MSVNIFSAFSIGHLLVLLLLLILILSMVLHWRQLRFFRRWQRL